MLASVGRNQQNRRDRAKHPSDPNRDGRKRHTSSLGNPGPERPRRREIHTPHRYSTLCKSRKTTKTPALPGLRPSTGCANPFHRLHPVTYSPRSRARPESRERPIGIQPILRHTGGSDGQASAFPALLYDDLRGHLPQGCIPMARDKRTSQGRHSRRDAILLTPGPVNKKRGQSRNSAPNSRTPARAG
jgi:hypothetical protein